MKKRVLITGGHLSPALALIEELKKRKGWEIFFVGRKYPLEGDKALSLEWQVVRGLGVPFFVLKTGRLQRRLTRYTLFSLLKIPIGLFQSFFILQKIQPAVIVSFGGYIAFPIALVGWLFRIPIITHEQTREPGLANRLIGLLAKKICLSWPETMGDFPKEKVVLTGNPVRKEIFNFQPGCREDKFLTFKDKIVSKDLPLIYITGGSLGAHAINEVVAEILPQLLRKYRIIHQCGDSQVYKDYEKLKLAALKLKIELKERYYLTKFVDPKSVGWVLNNADLVVSRAGINTITELLALGKPAILIPLPWAGRREQEKNAQILKRIGLAKILPQERLSGKSLYQCIKSMVQSIEKYKKNRKKGKKIIRPDAAKRIADILEKVLA